MKRFFPILLFLICGLLRLQAQPLPVVTYYDAEQTVIKEKYFITDAVQAQLTGEYISYYSTGNIESKGYYKNNLPDSLWEYHYENGNLKMVGHLKNGIGNGQWEYFYENGKPSMKGMLLENKKDGFWKYFFENGNLKSEGKYADNQKTGIWNYYFEDGNIRAQAFYTNNRGKYKEFYQDGTLKAEGLNINGRSDSTWTFYHENSALKAIGDYTNGVREGTWIFYHKNGEKSAEGPFAHGKKDGKWIYYHPNGEISSEGALRNGKKEGYWKIFGEDGLFKAEGVFEQNNGQYKEFYESGKLKAEGQIVDGKNHGQWYYYYEDGNLEGSCLFNKGDGEYTGYYKDGSVKMSGSIQDGYNVGKWKLYDEEGHLAGYYSPYYEDDKPVYKLIEEPAERGDYIKPEYKFKNNKLRYFQPKINEYKGFIVSTNPLAPVVGRLPLAVEYYIEERLGHELLFNMVRQPFFKPDSKIRRNHIYDRGFEIALRQKFYHPEGPVGMFYFGHEVRLSKINHFSNIIDSTGVNYIQTTISTDETKFEYSLIIGNRWMKLYGERIKNNSLGVTIDAFFGLGFGYRQYEYNFDPNPDYEKIFEDHNTAKLSISPRLGFHIGVVF